MKKQQNQKATRKSKNMQKEMSLKLSFFFFFCFSHYKIMMREVRDVRGTQK